MDSIKKWNVAGVILGVALVVIGIFFAVSAEWSLNTAGPGGPVSFGGEFYTYQYQMTQNVARNTSSVAENTYYIGKTITKYAGFAFVAWGILTIIRYGKAMAVEDAAGIAGYVGNTTEHGTSAVHTASAAYDERSSRAVPTGSWKCTCGRANAAYVSSCSCGVNKRSLGNH